ncbi:MAG: hypothetical protein HS104_08600 [Polyangiaceae bacterium]|nr:hypothetical protein [Polyangiaceae bacterium]MCL4751325.1 hypothetical protein [Myxococcales bacterium]
MSRLGLFAWIGLWACAEAPAPAEPQPAPGAAGQSAVVASPAEPAASECRARIAAAEGAPAEPGAPGFEARRAEILGRAKAEPVLFRRAPKPAEDVSTEVRSLRAQLAASPSPGWALHGVFKTVRNRPEVARALLLSEGYLYSEIPELAASFVDVVELHHLFSEPEITVQRGTQLLRAKKNKGFWYEYVDGPERGQRARLLLLDRVWPSGKEPGPPLHLSLRGVVLEAGIERVRVRHIGAEHVVMDARHGNDWVPTLLSIKEGGRLSVECQAVPEGRDDEVAHARELALRRQRVLSSLRSAIVEMVGEALPFDEPRTEEGQQDGNLRPAWRWAYTHGWDSYTFNDDTYLVFDAKGRPKVPQVCIDFVTDAFERAGGTWWAPSGAERERIRGSVDFDDIGIVNRRSVDVFIRFAAERPEMFDVYGLGESERVRFFERQTFFTHLAEHADRYLPGDVVAIHGPRSDGENHWHSFFVYDADPITGLPTLLASNAGKPRIRSWEGEMRAAPRRSIHTRVRPRLGWLESIVKPDTAVTEREPAPLISAPI